MQPRALARLSELSLNRRLDALAEGLDLVAEHVATLRDDVLDLAARDRLRALSMVTVQSEEEAAKALILLDLVRADVGDDQVVKEQSRRFYNHLARSLYVLAARMRPATFGEIRRLIDGERRSHYLDGPDGGEWTFRNQLIATREDSLYVDLVADDDGLHWTSPERYDSMHFGPETSVVDLVLALHRVGCFTRSGLDLVAAEWEGVVLEDDTHWQEVRRRNRRIVTRLHDGGLWLEDATPADAGRAVDQWGFPLASLDLHEIKLRPEELEAERARLTESFYEEDYGEWDSGV